jgi:hypothetical protein
MSSATIDEARQAKAKISAALQGASVAGVGVTKIGDSYAVKVNLSKQPQMNLPAVLDGVPIVYEIVGAIRAY